MRVVVVASQKGGEGKTTTTMNLAAVAAKNAKCLVVDVDPQKSATDWGLAAGDNLPFDFAEDFDPKNLARLRELDYDIIFVDTPGNLSDTHILGAVLDVADFAIVPMTPAVMSVSPAQRTIAMVAERGVPYRVLLNRVDMRIPGQLEEWVKVIDSTMGVPRFKQHVRSYTAHSEAPLRGHVVTQYPDTRKTTNAIFDYSAVALELTSIWAHSKEER
jgi:chromosome partitioning protein